jgi:hypothetical protein
LRRSFKLCSKHQLFESLSQNFTPIVSRTIRSPFPRPSNMTAVSWAAFRKTSYISGVTNISLLMSYFPRQISRKFSRLGSHRPTFSPSHGRHTLTAQSNSEALRRSMKSEPFFESTNIIFPARHLSRSRESRAHGLASRCLKARILTVSSISLISFRERLNLTGSAEYLSRWEQLRSDLA